MAQLNHRVSACVGSATAGGGAEKQSDKLNHRASCIETTATCPNSVIEPRRNHPTQPHQPQQAKQPKRPSQGRRGV